MMKNWLGICSVSILLLCCKNKEVSTVKAVNKASTGKDSILFVAMQFDEMHLLPAIKNKISSFYHLPVKTITATLPADAYSAKRDRYKGDIIIDYLSFLKGKNCRFVAGFTSKDISTKKGSIEDWGIFGLGTLDNGGCINSSYRLRKNASQQLLLERLQKVVLHEIGHNHGLDHCSSSFPCFMKDAEGKISTVDNEPLDLCTPCKKAIKL